MNLQVTSLYDAILASYAPNSSWWGSNSLQLRGEKPYPLSYLCGKFPSLMKLGGLGSIHPYLAHRVGDNLEKGKFSPANKSSDFKFNCN